MQPIGSGLPARHISAEAIGGMARSSHSIDITSTKRVCEVVARLLKCCHRALSFDV